MHTKEDIIIQTIPILAREGYAGTSMRKIAATIGKEPSNIYAHFADKESLLRATRMYIIDQLTRDQTYPDKADASTLLRLTIAFQLRNRTYIVALLQYFMAMRQDFPSTDGGYVPVHAYQHMLRVIRRGVEQGIYGPDSEMFSAKATTHMVNGFLMEYFDQDLSQADTQVLVEQLAVCIERALTRSEAVHA
jgi:AcrR family transcriptional regulator